MSSKIRIADEELLWRADEVYHEASKLRPVQKALSTTIDAVNSSMDLQRIVANPVRGYRGFPQYPLSTDFSESGTSLVSLFRRRRSHRKFKVASIAQYSLAKILYGGCGVVDRQSPDGITQWSLRAAPSAGGLRTIEAYCISLRVNGIPPGLYYYNDDGHALELVREGDFSSLLKSATLFDNLGAEAAAFVVLTACLPSLRFKYGERAYRFVLLEAGHVAQNMLLAVEDEGLAAVPLGGFLDDEVNALLDFDGVEDVALYLLAIGNRALST